VSYGIGARPRTCRRLRDDFQFRGGQPLYDRLWARAFCRVISGGEFRSSGDRCCTVEPGGIHGRRAAQFLDTLGEITGCGGEFRRSETNARVASTRLAFRMQGSVPELVDSVEGAGLTRFELYGEDARSPAPSRPTVCWRGGLAERGVRFITALPSRLGSSRNLPQDLPKRCLDVDRASAGLILDLEQRGHAGRYFWWFGAAASLGVRCTARVG